MVNNAKTNTAEENRKLIDAYMGESLYKKIAGNLFVKIAKKSVQGIPVLSIGHKDFYLWYHQTELPLMPHQFNSTLNYMEKDLLDKGYKFKVIRYSDNSMAVKISWEKNNKGEQK